MNKSSNDPDKLRDVMVVIERLEKEIIALRKKVNALEQREARRGCHYAGN